MYINEIEFGDIVAPRKRVRDLEKTNLFIRHGRQSTIERGTKCHVLAVKDGVIVITPCRKKWNLKRVIDTTPDKVYFVTKYFKEKRKVIKNKGNCFKAAALFVMKNRFATLCHANVKPVFGKLRNKSFAHAWAEVGDVVFDYSNGYKVVMRKEHYYELGGIKKVRRYNFKMMMKNILKHGTYGAWVKWIKNYADDEKC